MIPFSHPRLQEGGTDSDLATVTGFLGMTCDPSQPITLNSGTLVLTAKPERTLKLPGPSLPILPQLEERLFRRESSIEEKAAERWGDQTES